VTCSENVPLISEQDIGRETAGTFLGDYRTRVHINACREWPRGVVTPDFTRAVNSDAPVLILSNEADPAAPYWFGADAARHLPNGRQVIIRQVGHNYFSPCISGVVAEFISKGSAAGLNTSCLDNMARPPFATELPAEPSRRVRAADELKQVSDLSR
jgi:pimeloyl-ACP methyl ester carboxylesterase